ncbi:MAG: hypothetical protein LBK12_03845 [Odoribacteraceae bacterium]|nr:hypothetical protein [Odoribacteraceae bacterium]
MWVSLLLPLVIYQGCSKDDDAPDVPAGYSVEVAENDNMPSSGKIISQYKESQQGADIGKVVDNDKNTAYVTDHSTFYIVWVGSAAAAVDTYAITSGDAPAEHDPKSWKLLGSRDNQNWITLDTRTDQVFDERQATNRYSINNATRFKYYKLEVLANNGGASSHVAEWGLQEPDEDLDISNLIAAYSSGSSYTDATPMGARFANRQQTTPEIREWLLDPVNEPAVPKDLNNTFSLRASAVTLYPFGTPLPADANQHSIGDCGAVAAIAALAYQNSEFVKTLIVDNLDQTYTVHMFDPQGSPVDVRVSNKFVMGGNMKLAAASGKGVIATWSTVLEKAIMKYNTQYKVNPDIGGIGAEHVTPLFTGNGNSFAFKPKALTNAELAKVVKVSLLQGKFVLGGFRQGGLSVDGGSTVSSHVFTLMHPTKDNAMFAMRNPWGGNQNAADGNDGVLHIFSDTEIPALIDLRIIYPGRSGENGVTGPYLPPGS